MSLRLADDTLVHHAARVAVPTYDRAALTPAVVHMSVGSFHRSHQAVYFDDLAQRGITASWGVTGVGLHRPEMREVLAAQDGLYTVVARSAAGDEARFVGVIARYLFAPQDGDMVLDALTDRRTRLVTLTITGAAYCIDPASGAFDEGHCDVVADLAAPSRPTSALGHLVEALDRRRSAGLAPFTVLSCDNVPGNGEMTRRALVAFAALRDRRLAAWIDERVAFPSSMVDRITPKTTPADRDFVEQEFGVADRWPVITEPFSQWIIEDSFCDARPPLDEVGVRFVDDVRPYALLKTRLLNASHCALGHLGSLAGHRRTDEAMDDPVFGAYVTRLMDDEVAPLLPGVRGVDLGVYERILLERLANPKIGDELSRLRRNSSSKVPTHVLSSIAEARARGLSHPLLTLAVAGWCHHLRGVGEDRRRLTVDDPLAHVLQPLAVLGGTDPRPLLSLRSVFGRLGEDAQFAAELEQALLEIDRDGARAAVAACLDADRQLVA
ncbi:MAG: mannitol dehydrogenase family protein [Actinomycetota bacterium]|nr:mannitol dehydrogenase family protein [Actinomycetota bacterium]